MKKFPENISPFRHSMVENCHVQVGPILKSVEFCTKRRTGFFFSPRRCFGAARWRAAKKQTFDFSMGKKKARLTFCAEFNADHDGPHFHGVICSHGMGKPGFITLSAGFHRTSEHRT